MGFRRRSHRLRILSKMKGHAHLQIALFGQNSSDSYSGGRYHAWMAAEALALAGNDVTVITNNRPIFVQDFVRFPRHESIRVVLTPDFRTGLPDTPLDVIIVVPHKSKENEFFLSAEALAVRTGARLALMCFETPNWFNAMSPFKQDVALWSGWKYLAERCTAILCTTIEGERYARKFFSECSPETQFEQCYCGINTPVADSVPDRPREKRIICMSRFVFAEHKGGEGVANVVCEAMRGYTLVLIVGVGKVPAHVDSRLRAEGDRYGVRIEYKYQLSDIEKFEELKRARLLLFLSRFEGYGLPPLEAQYCNVPCIAFDLPVLREVSGDGITYVPADSYGEFRERIAGILARDECHDHLRTSIEPVVSFDVFSERLDKIFRRVARAKKPSILRSAAALTNKPNQNTLRGSTVQTPAVAGPRGPLWKRAGRPVVGVVVRALVRSRFCIRILGVLLRHDSWSLQRRLAESDDYRGIRAIAVADYNKVLKSIVFEGNFRVLRQLLAAGDWTSLRHVLFEKDSERLKEILFAENRKALKGILTEGDYRELGEFLDTDTGAVLDKLLIENDYARLQRALFKDNYRLLKEIITEKEGYRALHRLLIANEADLLKRVLDEDEEQPLKAVLFGNEFRFLRKVLLVDDAMPLQHLLFADDAELLKRILLDEDQQGLRKVLFRDNYRELRRVLSVNDSEPLRAVLLGGEKRELKEILFASKFRLLREMLLTGEATPLRHLLFADNAELLKRVLFDEGQLGLQEVLRHETYQKPRKLPDRVDSAVLRRLLFNNGAARLRRLLLLQSNPSHTLISVLEVDNYELLHQILAKHPETVLKALVLRDEDQILKQLLIDGAVLNEVFTNKRLDAVRRFQESWLKIIKLVSVDSPELLGRYDIAKKSIADRSQVDEKLLDVIYERGTIQLKNGDVEFPDRHSLVTLLHEILLNEDYYFETKTESPRILDCGTHIGLGIYYFKNLYPNARITGFEPIPALRKLAMDNIQRSGFDDVEILPYALSAEDKQTTFYISKEYSMAGSLVDRRRLMGDEVSEITVTCKKLSEYLNEPIHFLKLDIEGVEDEVLEEAKDLLPNVQYIFCEYHQGSGLAGDRLAKILTILEAAGFDVQIGKSHNFQNSSRYRPMNFVTGRYSGAIWAVNRNWTEPKRRRAPKASEGAAARPTVRAKTEARAKTTHRKKATPKTKRKTKGKSEANPEGKATSQKKTKANAEGDQTTGGKQGS